MSSPIPGALVRVRGQRWIVGDVEAGPEPLIELSSIEDGRYGEGLHVVWDVEVDAEVIDAGALPQPVDFDPPATMAAFLDAARWSSGTSADVYHLQAPFRAGAFIEDYQLEPLARALVAPRVNLLLADDVGLGKTIEAGLVALELLLRHRARKILVVAPAGLTSKWRDEMDEKFGLDFTVIDAEECARLRRVRGSAANPFRSHQLMIVSLPWLRTNRAQRLLNEFLPADIDPRHRSIDLLILDEAHHVAPAAPKQRYAVDSQQTKLIRSLAPHCEHRLFLSATPHNGYSESFTALLALVDNQRFARGVQPDRVSQRETVIRRLKRDVKTGAGATFLKRKSAYIEVEYTDEDRRAYDLLTRFVAARRSERRAARNGKRGDVVALLLKKRLYSSPAAFAATVAVVQASLARSLAPASSHGDTAFDDNPDQWPDEDDDGWADGFLVCADERDTLDDEDRREEEDAALRRATSGVGDARSADAQGLLAQMGDWAAPYAHRPDTKAGALIAYLRSVCLAEDLWLNERVVVFTEYRDTQNWLLELLRREGLAQDHRVGLLHGGMDAGDREQLRQRFQSAPGTTPETKIRILIATDAAAEGIDLHWHCHRMINYDIPFNPNRLEQRIGRIDRYGQRETPEVRHFVSTGWRRGGHGFDADADFLSRIAIKITQVESDLGSANPVLATAVQRAMLGQPVDRKLLEDPAPGGAPGLASDAGVREQVARLRTQLDNTVADLDITPERVRRLVGTGLRLARQAPLARAVDPDPVWAVPPLTGNWVKATDRLAHPLRPDELRPVTFDPAIARERREDVVYAHLNHPLVAMSTRLLTAAAASDQVQLSRTSVVVGRHPGLTEPLAVAYARFLVIGGDAVRLHEEVVHAGGWIRPGGRFARVESLRLLGDIVAEALEADRPQPSATAEQQVRAAWPGTEAGLIGALEWRVRTRGEQVRRALDRRREGEVSRNRLNFQRFTATLTETLDVGAQDELPLTEAAEANQRQRDREAAAERLAALPVEEAAEAGGIDARYRNLTEHTFPLAVVFVLPEADR